MVACFYMPLIGIAVERARLNHLWGEPVGLTSADGALAAVSEEAEPFGIRMGQDANGAKALCQNLILLPYDRPAYEEAAHAIWDLFAIESSFVEPVSPEVCFVELPTPDAVERAQKLALDLAANVRIPVKAGLAHSKFVARKAAECGRRGDVGDDEKRKTENENAGCGKAQHLPHSPLTIPSGKEARFLARIPLDGVPGLDYKTHQKLSRLGVRTFGDVLKLPKRELTRQWKELGFLLYRLAKGEDFERVRPLWPPRRLERGIEFEDETSDETTVHESLRRCAESLARNLQQKREFCRTVTLRVRQVDESWQEESEKLAIPSDSVSALHASSLRLLRRIPLEQPLLGVMLRAGDLGAGSGLQLALLDENRHGAGLPHERNRSLEAALAFLRKRFGPGAVVTCRMMRQARRIGLWTYPLGHLLNEPVQVATDDRGRPVRYWRKGRPREVKRIHDRWKETEWFWGGMHEKTVYRVETDPSGLSELHSLHSHWRLSALSD
jgi:DNA polymerase-4